MGRRESPEFAAGAAVSEWPARLPARFLLGAASTFFALLLGAELGSRLALKSGFFYRKFDFSGVVSDLPELRDRIAWAASRPRPVFVLGDSVLGASALVEHGVRHGRAQTIPAFLAPLADPQGWSVTSLGADGLLVPDLLGLCREFRATPPRRLLVILNVRMFAAEFGSPAAAVSRDFLLPDVAETIEGPRAAVSGISPDFRVADWVEEHLFLLRATRLLRTLWYFPSRRDFYRRLIERVPGGSEDVDLKEAALRLKVGPYYHQRWSDEALPFHALAALMETVEPIERTVIVLSPQNPDFIEDREAFEGNRRILGDFIRARASRSVEFRDLADLFAPDRFLDHCHLTPSGNRDYARRLAALIRS